MFLRVFLLSTGLWVVSLGLRGHYVFLNQPRTWHEAQSYCREKHTDLATIENTEDLQRMTDVVDGNFDGSAWIGLHGDSERWRWSLERSDMYGDRASVFSGWWDQPDNTEGRELCVYIRMGKWNDFQCDYGLMAVCYDERGNDTERYVLLKTYMTWTEAREYCREHHTDLASVKNDKENHIISSIVGDDAAWIGLHRTAWSDMSRSSFTFWGTLTDDSRTYRQQKCVVVWYRDSGGWTLETCDKALPFICYSGTSPRMYHLEGERKSWLDAQKHCREKYTDLATVDNTEDMDRLMGMTSGSYNGFAWIGMYDDLFSSWRWSLEDEVIQGAGEYRNWDSAQDYTDQGHCVATLYGAWLTFSCKIFIRFICYDDKNGSPSYVLSDQPATWSDAQSYCRRHHTDLASVRSSTDNKIIAHRAGSEMVWIGLYRGRTWSDQSNSSFRHWKSGQPDYASGDQNCVAASLADSGKWTNQNCLDVLPFFCYSELREDIAAMKEHHPYRHISL